MAQQRRNTQGRGKPSGRSAPARSGRSEAGSSNSGRVRPVKPTATSSGRIRREGGKTASSSGRLPGVPTSREDTASHGRGRRGGGKQGFQQGRGLKGKFTLVMSTLTLLVTLVLGGVLIYIADSFLFNLTKHNGVELAKAMAQIGVAVRDMNLGPAETEERLTRYLRDAVTWDSGEGIFADMSFVDAVTFDRGSLSGLGIGELPEGDSTRDNAQPISLPGRSTVKLPTPSEDIIVYTTTREVAGGEVVPVYRFNIALNNPGGGPNYSGARVWVDVAYDTVQTVSLRLIITVGVVTLLAVGGVILVANMLAGQITRPVSLLKRDMEQVASGNLDHRTKPHSQDEVGYLAVSFDEMTQKLKTATQAIVEQEKREYELSLAHEVQAQLLPAQAPEVPGFELAAYYKGAGAVSGDYYDFIPLGDGLWGFIVADVSGKGIPGSMVMAVTRTIIRLVATRHRSNAAETLKETNRLIAKQIKRGMFVTAFYAVIDQRTGQMTYASAGHNPMVVYRQASNSIELAAAKGIAIGFNEGPLFDKNIEQKTAVLGPGDQFVIYTDGFPEAMNEKEEEFGDDEFYQLIQQHGAAGAKGLVQQVVGAIAGHRGRAAQSDDLTIIAVRRVGG